MQVFTIAALGGLSVVVGIVLTIAAALGLLALTARLYDAREAWRERREQRRILADCHAIDALPTIDHPTEKPR